MTPVQALFNSAGGLILILSLVTGLINFPTSCDCGAGIPHGHSLFVVSTHRHQSSHYSPAPGAVSSARRAPEASVLGSIPLIDSVRHQTSRASTEHQHGHQHADGPDLDDVDGPQLQAPAGSTYGSSQIAVDTVWFTGLPATVAHPAPDIDRTPCLGRNVVPEPPPPQFS